MLKRLWRSALDHELGVLGEEIGRALAQLDDLGIKLEALAERVERRMNTLGMRTARAARPSAEEQLRALPASFGGSDGPRDAWQEDLDAALRGERKGH